MKTIINPERLVSVPFSKTRCGVDFYINTGESKDICGVLTEHRTFKTDFFGFYFLRRANGYVLLNFHKIMLCDNMVLLLSPHQQQEWHVDEAELDYTFLIFREDFMRTFLADKFNRTYAEAYNLPVEAMKDEDDFRIRTYTKKELACLYCPNATARCAIRTLTRWIKRNRELYAALLLTGYNVRVRTFMPKQVGIIVQYLNEP